MILSTTGSGSRNSGYPWKSSKTLFAILAIVFDIHHVNLPNIKKVSGFLLSVEPANAQQCFEARLGPSDRLRFHVSDVCRLRTLPVPLVRIKDWRNGRFLLRFTYQVFPQTGGLDVCCLFFHVFFHVSGPAEVCYDVSG